MSVFGFLKRGRQAAKEHKAGLAEKQRAEEQKPAYRHVPTHAAVDALSGAPSSWRDDDRVRIIEENRRRSAMIASRPPSGPPAFASNPVHQGMPRVNSALSHVTYPSAHANPVVSLPRAYSYNGHIHAPWVDQLPPVSMGKGKRVPRTMSVGGPSRGSRASSKAPSIVGSSSDSTSSQDDLEMKSFNHRKAAAALTANEHEGVLALSSSEETTKSESRAHRLHPSRRKPSDLSFSTSKDRYYPPRAGFRPTVHRQNSAPAGSTDIPPVPLLPPIMASHSANSSTSSAGYSMRSSSSSAAPHAGSSAGRDLVTPRTAEALVSPVISQVTSVSPPAAAAVPLVTHESTSAPHLVDFDFSFDTSDTTITPPTLDTSPTNHAAVKAEADPTPDAKAATSTSTTARPRQHRNTYSAFPTIQDQTYGRDEAAVLPGPQLLHKRDSHRASLTSRQLPVEFDEAAFAPAAVVEQASRPPSASASQKTGKGKLTKSHPPVTKPSRSSGRRWSFSSRSSAVVG